MASMNVDGAEEEWWGEGDEGEWWEDEVNSRNNCCHLYFLYGTKPTNLTPATSTLLVLVV